MNSKNLIRIAVAMGVSMLGLIFIEIYWIKNAIDLRNSQLTRDVNDVMAQVAKHVETIRKERSLDIQHILNQREDELFSGLDSLSKSAIHNGETWRVKIIEESTKDSAGQIVKHTREKKYGTDSPSIQPSEPSSTLAEYSEFMVKQKELDLKSDSIIIDSMLREDLTIRGIEAPFYFAIIDDYQNIILRSDTTAEIKCLQISRFKKELAGNNKTAPKEVLSLVFQNLAAYELQNIWVMLIASALFTLVMLWIFYYTLSSIVKQKKLADIRSDFISNMTHEFKTPISTISLACEALNDPEVEKTEEKVFNYIGIIHDENKRLSLLVENVLQTALIEKDGLKLKLEELNINQLINKVVNNMGLMVEKKGGELLMDLKADHEAVLADRVHLTNVIFNLIDNALKYTIENPLIVISTRNQNNGLVISVSDNGVGISKENRERIFEKFYRVPTGNVHDVKGFGLGLSYVKAITDMHHGEIHIESEVGKGSTFEIFLPQDNLFSPEENN